MPWIFANLVPHVNRFSTSVILLLLADRAILRAVVWCMPHRVVWKRHDTVANKAGIWAGINGPG